jgi:hypothetical protein
VAARKARPNRLFSTTWVHVFEEDTAEGQVYRAEDDNIPLSRRPRERLVLKADGSARVLVPGPDDRLVERPARWTERGDAVVIRARGGDAELRIVQRSPSRLVVQTRPAEPPG